MAVDSVTKFYEAQDKARRLLGPDSELRLVKIKTKRKLIGVSRFFQWLYFKPTYRTEYQIGFRKGVFNRFSVVSSGCCWQEAIEKIENDLILKNKEIKSKEEEDLNDILKDSQKLKLKLTEAIVELRNDAYDKQNYKLCNNLGGRFTAEANIVKEIELKANLSKAQYKPKKIKRQLGLDNCLYIPSEMTEKWKDGNNPLVYANVFEIVGKGNKPFLILSINQCESLKNHKVQFMKVAEYVIDPKITRIQNKETQRLVHNLLRRPEFWIRKLDKDNILIESAEVVPAGVVMIYGK